MDQFNIPMFQYIYFFYKFGWIDLMRISINQFNIDSSIYISDCSVIILLPLLCYVLSNSIFLLNLIDHLEKSFETCTINFPGFCYWSGIYLVVSARVAGPLKILCLKMKLKHCLYSYENFIVVLNGLQIKQEYIPYIVWMSLVLD